MTPSKKSEVITTITTTNISTTTTTVKKETEDGETVEVKKSTEESAAANGGTGEENKKQEEVQAEPQSRGSTLKREGVTFDVTSTPSKSPFSSSSSVSCLKLISTCLSRCKQFYIIISLIVILIIVL